MGNPDSFGIAHYFCVARCSVAVPNTIMRKSKTNSIFIYKYRSISRV